LKSRSITTGAYAPRRIMSNQEVSALVDTSDEWIFSHTGIRRRHIAEPDQAASDLGVEAARIAFARAEALGTPVLPEEVDLILCATSTPDFLSFPSTASIMQDKLQLKHAGAMDIGAACTGFIYAVETAKAFVESGMAKYVLVVGTEVNSRILNWKDRSTCVLFGDGAGAAIIGAAVPGEAGGIGKGVLRSKGSGASYLGRNKGSTRQPMQSGSVVDEDYFISMNGRQVYIFAVQAIIDAVRDVLAYNGLTMAELDWIVPHQANRRIIEAACEREGWDINKFCINIDEYANTSAASIPLAMEDMILDGRLQKGHKLVTVGFGAGLTYGGNYLVW
jgi:3-oxoacyl-[acyl-carrier-protein] synthase III